MQELEDEKLVEENKKMKKQKKKGKHKVVDVDDAGAACGAAGGAAAGHAAGAAAREQAEATARGGDTVDPGGDAGGGLLGTPVYPRRGTNKQSQTGGAAEGGRGLGPAGVSVAGDSKVGGAAEDAARLGWTVT